MKKADVKIGGVYYAKVTNRKVEVRIDAEKPRGGWDATNLATNKRIVIKSAQRLQGEVGVRRGRSKAATEGSVTVAENESATVETGGGRASTTAVLKKPRKVKAAKDDGVETGEKKLSCVAAALKVLSESSEPMNSQEMIATMEAKGYWASPGGKTPHATLYSAILRELTKGEQSRFVKTERGRFTVRG